MTIIDKLELADGPDREIRRLRGIESPQTLGQRFGVSACAVYDIYAQRTWSNLP